MLFPPKPAQIIVLLSIGWNQEFPFLQSSYVAMGSITCCSAVAFSRLLNDVFPHPKTKGLSLVYILMIMMFFEYELIGEELLATEYAIVINITRIPKANCNSELFCGGRETEEPGEKPLKQGREL
jgi:hypothetical protein